MVAVVEGCPGEQGCQQQGEHHSCHYEYRHPRAGQHHCLFQSLLSAWLFTPAVGCCYLRHATLVHTHIGGGMHQFACLVVYAVEPHTGRSQQHGSQFGSYYVQRKIQSVNSAKERYRLEYVLIC